MQQLPDNIPDNKPAFKTAHENVLTHEQTELVNEARKKIKEDPVQFFDWEKVRKIITAQ